MENKRQLPRTCTGTLLLCKRPLFNSASKRSEGEGKELAIKTGSKWDTGRGDFVKQAVMQGPRWRACGSSLAAQDGRRARDLCSWWERFHPGTWPISAHWRL